jgi:phospholipase/carboxylesterase
MSPTHLAADEWEPRMAARKGLPVFMSHGWEDELLLFATSESLHTTLLEHGLPVEWVPFRGGHGIPPEVITGAGDFITRVLA